MTRKQVNWKIIPDFLYTGKHRYEVSTSGTVRRLLHSGSYKELKPWLSGGRTMREYFAVWLYGYPKTKDNELGRKKYLYIEL